MKKQNKAKQKDVMLYGRDIKRINGNISHQL